MGSVNILNRQKVKRISLKELKQYSGRVLKLLKISSRVSVVLCDNSFIKGLNKKYFKKNQPTDVISFPLKDKLEPDYLGEVVVSVEEAVKVSGKLDLSWKKELLLYIIHGILHLAGWRDSTKSKRVAMERKQAVILESILAGNK